MLLWKWMIMRVIFLDFTNWTDVRICNTKNQGIVDEFCERILKNKKAKVCISESDIWMVIEEKHRDRCTFEWCVNPQVNDLSKLKLGPETDVTDTN